MQIGSSDIISVPRAMDRSTTLTDLCVYGGDCVYFEPTAEEAAGAHEGVSDDAVIS